jgi:gluconate 5-dehydrogenase
LRLCVEIYFWGKEKMQDKLFSVEDQVVLVSGGSRGIGRALAEGFAERNAQVIIAGRETQTLAQTAKEISTGKHAVATEVCDVAIPEDVAATVDRVVKKFGRIDTLLSVAGVNKRMKAENYTMDEYDWIIDINLRGAFAIAQAVGRHMIGRKSGVIINIDSLNTYAPLTGVTPYAISKAGVLMMTRALAQEWGKHGVRVNSIAPGFFPTALSGKMWAQEKMSNWAKTNTPLGKLGDVKELVGAAIYLASPASSFVTGQTIRVDGGVTAGLNWPIDL